MHSLCSPCLLRNSSKKPFYFDVLKVSFRYLQVEDKQGSSVVIRAPKTISPRRHGAQKARISSNSDTAQSRSKVSARLSISGIGSGSIKVSETGSQPSSMGRVTRLRPVCFEL